MERRCGNTRVASIAVRWDSLSKKDRFAKPTGVGNSVPPSLFNGWGGTMGLADTMPLAVPQQAAGTPSSGGGGYTGGTRGRTGREMRLQDVCMRLAFMSGRKRRTRPSASPAKGPGGGGLVSWWGGMVGRMGGCEATRTSEGGDKRGANQKNTWSGETDKSPRLVRRGALPLVEVRLHALEALRTRTRSDPCGPSPLH